MNQFQTITVDRCINCGRVFLTQGGAARHTERCKYSEPVIEG